MKVKNSTPLPECYRVQNGCHNCKYVFVMYEYDDNDRFFCTKNSRNRPVCGSVFMGESFGDVVKSRGIRMSVNGKYSVEYRKLSDRWWKWKERREVSHSGICKEYGVNG